MCRLRGLLVPSGADLTPEGPKPFLFSGTVSLTGPGGFSRSLTAPPGTSTFSFQGVPAGDYTATASPIASGGYTYKAGTASGTLGAGGALSLSLDYAPATGALAVSVSAPSGASTPTLRLLDTTGREVGRFTGYQHTFGDLLPGTYTLVPEPLTDGSGFGYRAPTATVSVSAGSTASASVLYVKQSATLTVNISGLPQGASADVRVSGPRTLSLTASGSLELPLGTYTISASSVSFSGYQYLPTVDPGSVDLALPGEAKVVSVSYREASGSVDLSVSGLPQGASVTLSLGPAFPELWQRHLLLHPLAPWHLFLGGSLPQGLPVRLRPHGRALLVHHRLPWGRPNGQGVLRSQHRGGPGGGERPPRHALPHGHPEERLRASRGHLPRDGNLHHGLPAPRHLHLGGPFRFRLLGVHLHRLPVPASLTVEAGTTATASVAYERRGGTLRLALSGFALQGPGDPPTCRATLPGASPWATPQATTLFLPEGTCDVSVPCTGIPPPPPSTPPPPLPPRRPRQERRWTTVSFAYLGEGELAGVRFGATRRNARSPCRSWGWMGRPGPPSASPQQPCGLPRSFLGNLHRERRGLALGVWGLPLQLHHGLRARKGDRLGRLELLYDYDDYDSSTCPPPPPCKIRVGGICP